jgi:biopolymer transport protein ExbD
VTARHVIEPRSITLIALFLPPAMLVATAQSLAEEAGSNERVVEYAPHVRINWTHRRVEVDGEICLREGLLELLVCSTNTREHESIVASPARPLRIYEALGLVGLSPGKPVRYDKSSKKWLPPSGQRMRIDVRWTSDEQTRTVDVGTWTRDIETGDSIPPGGWVFAGSYRTDRGAFAADQDGTIVCVVDFASALIALPELRSADNRLLRLEAYKKKIPPAGTSVTLLLSPAEVAPFRIHVDADGQPRVNDTPTELDALQKQIRKLRGEQAAVSIVVYVNFRAPLDEVDKLIRAIRKAAGPDARIKTIGSDAKPEVDPTPHSDDSEQP